MPTSSTRAFAARDSSMICARFSRLAASGRPRRPSLPPSSTITIGGLVRFERARQARESALRGLAAHAGVDDAVPVPFGGESLRSRLTQPCWILMPYPALRLSPSTTMVRWAGAAALATDASAQTNNATTE